jgi:hypothetical protein
MPELMGIQMQNMKKGVSWIAALLIISASIFALFEFVDGHLFGLMNNALCFKYLGCNAGFFGYDAIAHFASGIIEIIFILWLAKKTSRFNFLHNNFWKSVLILMAIVALIGVGWEILEFVGDHVRMYVFHEDLLRPANRLFQPSNSDTVGDLTFGLLGATITILILGLIDRALLGAARSDSEAKT